MTAVAVATSVIIESVKAANPQGGMADPNGEKSFATTTSSYLNKKSSPAAPAEAGLEARMAGLDICKEEAGRDAGIANNGNSKPINQLKIPAHQHDERKLFVGGLPTHVTEAEFLQFFEQFGEVIDSVVMIDRVTRRSRGFGFVTFAKAEVAQSLLNAIPGKTGMISIQGKNCEIKASEPKSMDTPRYIHGSGNHHRTPHPHPPTIGSWTAAKPTGALTLQQVTKGYSAPNHHGPNDRYYDPRNFDELYSGHYAANYTPSATYGGGYQYPPGWEASYPPETTYAYGHHYARGTDEHPTPHHHHHQYAHSHGYYAHPSGRVASSAGTYSQYSYHGSLAHPQAAAASASSATYAGYHSSAYYTSPGVSGQSSPIQGVYASDGSLESYGEANYYGGVVGKEVGPE